MDKRDRNSKNVADPASWLASARSSTRTTTRRRLFHYHLESYRYFPINLDVISWLDVWYVKSELYKKAIQFFERASQIQPNEVKWCLMVTSCYRRMGAYQKAMVLYEQIHQDYPENLECLRYLVAICKDLGQRCDGFQAKLAKLERDNAVNTKMPPQQPQSLGNGHSSRNSNVDDSEDQRAPPSYQRQPHEMQYQRQDSGRALPASNYVNGNSMLESRTRDSEENDRSEYVAPLPMQTVAPTTARAPEPQKTARLSKHDDTDDWGDADVRNLLGD